MEENKIIQQEELQEEELMHYGILGMKWGVRRYQRPDGSLTNAGKKRYNSEIESLKAEKAKVDKVHKNLNAAKRMQARKDKLEADIEAQKKQNEEDRENLKGGEKKAEHDAKKAEREARREEHKAEKAAEKAEEKAKSKSASEMSDEELNAAINRLRMEQTYNQLYSQMNPEKKSAGKEYLKTFVDRAIVPAVSDVAKDYLTKLGKEALGLNEKKTKSAMDKLEETVKKSKLETELEELKVRQSEAKKKQEKISSGKEDIDYEAENKRLKAKNDYEELSDADLQSLKREAQKAKYQETVDKSKNGKVDQDVIDNPIDIGKQVAKELGLDEDDK